MAVINVVNPGSGNDIYPNLVTAVTAAANGDTLSIPTGNFTVRGRCTITKLLSIQGQGVGITILRRDNADSDGTVFGWESIFRYAINSEFNSNIIIDGITFQSKTPSVITGDGGSMVADVGINMVNCVDFVIRNCKFQYFGNAAILIEHRNKFARGLIHTNEFSQNLKGSAGLGLGYGVLVSGEAQSGGWLNSAPLGTWNSIFIENNTFDRHRHSVASAGQGMYVCRYNTCTNNYINNPVEPYTHCIDTHSARGTGDANYFGTRQVEIYNNTITNTTFWDGTPITAGQSVSKLVELCIAIRSGEGVCYNNTISGYRFGGGIYVDDTTLGSAYPLYYAPGWASGQIKGSANTTTDSIARKGDFYYYNNTFTDPVTQYGVVGSTGAFLNYNVPTGSLVVDRDYKLSAPANYVAAPYPHYKRI